MIEILKRNHIAFTFRPIILDMEVDFLIGNTIVEIGDHSQNIDKNRKLIEAGYSLLTYSNKIIKHRHDIVESKLKQLCPK